MQLIAVTLALCRCSSVSAQPAGVNRETTVTRASVNAHTDQELAAIIADERANASVRELAISVMGDRRAKEGIGPLLDQLLFAGQASGEFRALAVYPAAQALVNYGDAVYPLIWARLERDCDPAYLYVLAFTLADIETIPNVVARLKQKAADSALRAKQSTNIASLTAFLETTDFKDPANWPIGTKWRKRLGVHP
jgi:hypothetical protein